MQPKPYGHATARVACNLKYYRYECNIPANIMEKTIILMIKYHQLYKLYFNINHYILIRVKHPLQLDQDTI